MTNHIREENAERDYQQKGVKDGFNTHEDSSDLLRRAKTAEFIVAHYCRHSFRSESCLKCN